MMSKKAQKGNDNRQEVDKAKRVYRTAVEAIKRLDDICKQRNAHREVFRQDAVGLRNKLKECCERLMFYNPLDYGRKAEEVLWRKVFYDIIQLVKRSKKHIRPGSSLDTAFRTHFSSATGYYYHLLLRMQSEFTLKLDGVLDFGLVSERYQGRQFTSQNNKKKEVSSTVSDWALQACHRCLICLGDISRYQQEFSHGVSLAAAERFYHQALILCPGAGMPHNQLGTLVGARYYHCEAAYHYIRCMVCENPFSGAEGNLKRLFEKNRKRFQEIEQNGVQNTLPEQQQAQDLKCFFVKFLHLLDTFLDTSKSTEAQELQETCQTTLQSFNLCMFYEPIGGLSDVGEVSQSHLDDDIIFKVIVILMSTIHILQKKGCGQVTAATAFLLALFSHILNHVINRLQSTLYEKENPNKLLQSATEINDVDDADVDEEDEDDCMTENGILSDTDERRDDIPNHVTSTGHSNSKRRSLGLKNLRRRRRRTHNSDSSDLSDVSDLSEGGEELEDTVLSEESDDYIVSYFHDSDSDLSDTLMDSQELRPGFSTNLDPHATILEEDSQLTDVCVNGQNGSWTDSTKNNHLANFSMELLSQSMMFPGQTFRFPAHSQNLYDADLDGFDDVIQGRRQVSIPPGFSKTTEAQHVAEITLKMTEFTIETDTETSVAATDTENSTFTENDFDSDCVEQSSTDSSKARLEAETKRIQSKLEVLQAEGLLYVVKIICDWMMCNSGVIMTCAQSSQSLWYRLCVLLNFLPLEKVLAQHDQCWLDELSLVLSVADSLKWEQVFPLTEDVSLCQFPPLQETHTLVNSEKKRMLTDTQECFLRLACLRHFGYFLSNLENVNFHYDLEEDLFIGPTPHNITGQTEKQTLEKMATAESRQNQLMKDMAQLRLQAEVNQMEGSLQSSDQPIFPPYLIVDTSALCDHLSLVKQLMQTNRGILIIPLSVIDMLDFMKKDTVGARDAIRWLESELRRGNRYIRAQKGTEICSRNANKQLKRKNQDLWCWNEVLDCAQYFAKQGSDITSNMVAVITTSKHGLDRQIEGVVVENIEAFSDRWKELCKNKG